MLDEKVDRAKTSIVGGLFVTSSETPLRWLIKDLPDNDWLSSVELFGDKMLTVRSLLSGMGSVMFLGDV